MNVRDGEGDMMARWDPRTGRWVDDPPGHGSPWWRTTVVITLAALLGGAAGLGVWALAARGDDTDRRTSASGSAPSTPSSVSAVGPEGDGDTESATPKEPSASGGDPTGDAPRYVRSVDPAGFTVDVPSGWDRTAKEPTGKPTVVTYESPDGTRVLQLFEVSEEDPASSLDLAENEPDYGFGGLPGYRALDRSTEATHSEVVYRFDGEGDLGPRQVIDHRFYTPDGKIYGIRSSAPESSPLAQVREPVTIAATSLCPTGATCVRG